MHGTSGWLGSAALAMLDAEFEGNNIYQHVLVPSPKVGFPGGYIEKSRYIVKFIKLSAVKLPN